MRPSLGLIASAVVPAVAFPVYIVGTGWTTATNEPSGSNLIGAIPTLAANGSSGGWGVDANSSYSDTTETFTTSNGGGHFFRNAANPTLPAGTYEFGFQAKLGTMTTPAVSIYGIEVGDVLPSTSYASRINSSTFTLLRFRFTTTQTLDLRVYPARDGGTSGTLFVDSATPYLKAV